MKRAHLTSIILLRVLAVVSPAFAQTLPDPHQRDITFYNEMAVPIHPVIQARWRRTAG